MVGITTLEPSWCHVPAGEYLIGSADSDPQASAEEKPPQTVILSAFEIAAYPVTNAQFALFIADAGYQQPRYWNWNAHALAWFTEYHQYADRFPASADITNPTLPMTAISWFETLAFCQWLGQQLSESITLPTEAQWEAAARGPHHLIYPWGNSYTTENFHAYQHPPNSQLVPVDAYPNGRSWCGAFNMLGNIEEWTHSNYHHPNRHNIFFPPKSTDPDD